LQRVAPETRTKGGLLLPEAARAGQREAVVLAVGPGGRDPAGATVPSALAVGDKVLLPEHGGGKLEMGGEEFHIFREADIVARL
jgi:chaperonin GroES